MASSNVSSFIQRVGQGVKPNMFMVDVNFPGSLSKSADDLETTNIMCKSAALPGSNLGVIEVPFRGRTVKIAGDRTFDTWTVTFFNDKTSNSVHFLKSGRIKLILTKQTLLSCLHLIALLVILQI